MKYHIILFLLLIKSTIISSQNLIPNPGFEDYKKDCFTSQLDSHDNIECLNNWFNPSFGLPGYENIKDKYSFHPFKPHKGNGMITLDITINYDTLSEYISVELKKALEKNTKYKLSFYLKVWENTGVVYNNLGIIFSENKIHKISRYELYKYTPQIIWENPVGSYEWLKYENYYIAKGGEKYITIGAFNKNNSVLKKILNIYKMNNSSARYYLDDITLESIEKLNLQENTDAIVNTEITTIIKDQPKTEILNIEKGKSIVLKNIFFEFNSAVLKDSSFTELNLLVKYLTENNNSSIQINGYTDNIGSAEYNKKLSEDRAKAVADYLISKNINKERINYSGFGKENPISSNENDEGRSKNRRVEFIIQ
ncbi:MAG TPA: OmpA family protein [Bacteroidales bacterium]|nr:OmpA family protein [Bacteroidales bacterium]HPS16146.1 OmpA family protein [Bacteroidales bacterium]